MLIEDAYKMLIGAKGGCETSKALFNNYATQNGLCLYCEETPYNGINTYDDFYNLVYHYTMAE